jgi:regulator of sigma D
MMAWNSMGLEKNEKHVYIEQLRKHTRSNSKTLNGFAKQFLDLINSGTFQVRRDKCEEIQPFMGPRRFEYATDD